MPEIMPAAPMKYDKDGNPEWNNMWNKFCGLALEGGPAHRSTDDKIIFPNQIDDHDAYQKNANELVRGLKLLKAKNISVKDNGEIYINLKFKNKARWFAMAINTENVAAKSLDKYLILPCSDKFITEKEIKSVLTVWGKANHYFKVHRNWAMKLVILFTAFDVVTSIKVDNYEN